MCTDMPPVDFRDVERSINQRWRELGYESLLPEEQGFIALWYLDVELNNGGLHQYLTNGAGDTAQIAVATLEELGLKETPDIVRKAMRLLEPAGGYVVDRTERWKRIDSLPDLFDRLTELDRRYYASDERFLNAALGRVAGAYARENVALLIDTSRQRTRAE